MRVFESLDEVVLHMASLGTTISSENKKFTELDHGLQCAALLQVSDPDDVELQVAGLIHDLAHPWDGPGQPRHASMGAMAVRPLLGPRISALIEGHIPAKRYLVATSPDYRSVLSLGSIETLEAQGGAMDDQEIQRFENQQDWKAMVSLRISDDGAKVPGALVPPLAYWIEAIETVASANGRVKR